MITNKSVGVVVISPANPCAGCGDFIGGSAVRINDRVTLCQGCCELLPQTTSKPWCRCSHFNSEVLDYNKACPAHGERPDAIIFRPPCTCGTGILCHYHEGLSKKPDADGYGEVLRGRAGQVVGVLIRYKAEAPPSKAPVIKTTVEEWCSSCKYHHSDDCRER